MKLFKEGTQLTPLASLVMNEEINKIEKELKNGWNINEKLQITERTKEYPIIFALYYNKTKVIDFLLKIGAELNIKGSPAIPAAADSCSIETIKLLLKHGANLNAVNNVGSNAIDRALINDRYELISELIKLGIDVRKDGSILRSAVYKRQYPAVQILLAQGVDVNYHTPDMVFPYNPTAVQVAARNNDFDTVKLLVERRADVTIKDEYGARPYTEARNHNNHEMMEYLKRLEPEVWHNEEQRLFELKPYKLPRPLIDFLRSKELKVNIENNEYVSYIMFNALVDCREVKWNGYKYLDLLCEVDNHSPEGFLIWYPKKKCLASVDYEHQEFKVLDKWENFIKNPSEVINRIFETE